MDPRTDRLAQRMLAVMGLSASVSACASAPAERTDSNFVDLTLAGSASAAPSQTSLVGSGAGSKPTNDPRPPSSRTSFGPFQAEEDYGSSPPTCVDSPNTSEQCPRQATLNNSRGQREAPLVRVDGDKCCYGPAAPGFHWRGRALRGPAGVALAPTVSREGWSEDAPFPLDDIPGEERLALAEVWLRDAAFEHASVASFARLSLDLLALGAPADLVADAHRAALDEVRHAEIAYGIAGRLLGRRVGPSPLATPQRPPPSLAVLAQECFRDGCYGESVAVMLAHAAWDATVDPTLRRAYERIAEDEQRHAELAYRVVAWAFRAESAEVRDTLSRERDELAASLDRAVSDEDAVHAPLERYGVLSETTEASVRDQTVRVVVLPAIDRLLAA